MQEKGGWVVASRMKVGRRRGRDEDAASVGGQQGRQRGVSRRGGICHTCERGCWQWGRPVAPHWPGPRHRLFRTPCSA